MNAANLETSTFCFPKSPALVTGEKEMTYAEFNDRTNRFATALKDGIQDQANMSPSVHRIPRNGPYRILLPYLKPEEL